MKSKTSIKLNREHRVNAAKKLGTKHRANVVAAATIVGGAVVTAAAVAKGYISDLFGIS